MILRPQAAAPQTKERALQLARERLRARAPEEIAACAGARYAPLSQGQGRFALRFLREKWDITYPDGWVTRQDTGSPAKEALSLLLLHYLVHADGHPLAVCWVAFRELPDGLIYDQAFRRRVEPPLLAHFGDRPERLRVAATALGGEALPLGDLAFRFDALPKVPLALIWHRGDEEFPPAFSLLFDGAAGHYLPTEDLAVLGGMLVGALLKAAPR